MLEWAFTFFIMSVATAVFAFVDFIPTVMEIAKVLFIIFTVLFLVLLVAGLIERPR